MIAAIKKSDLPCQVLEKESQTFNETLIMQKIASTIILCLFVLIFYDNCFIFVGNVWYTMVCFETSYIIFEPYLQKLVLKSILHKKIPVKSFHTIFCKNCPHNFVLLWIPYYHNLGQIYIFAKHSNLICFARV